jgi:hypothetical protein
MAEISIEELITEATGNVPAYVGDGGSFASNKRRENNYTHMLEILLGKEPFEFKLKGNPERVKSLVTFSKELEANKEAFEKEHKQLKAEYNELTKKTRKTAEEYNRQEKLASELKTYQLKKTLRRFESTLRRLEPVVDKKLNAESLTSLEEKEYKQLVIDLEDALFQETYGRYHFAYDPGEGSGRRQSPTVEHMIPVKFAADNGKNYYGVVRPPTGIITWEGKEARDAWVNDKQISQTVDSFISKHRQSVRDSSILYSRDAILKIRVDPQTYKVFNAEPLNKVLLGLREGSKKKITYDDSDAMMEKIFQYMWDTMEAEEYDVWGAEVEGTSKHDAQGREIRGTAEIAGSIDHRMYNLKDKDGNPIPLGKKPVEGKKGVPGVTFDEQHRPLGFQQVINSIGFWKMIRGLF